MSPDTLHLAHATDKTAGGISLRGVLPVSPGFYRRPMRTLDTYGLVYVDAGEGLYTDANGALFHVKAGTMLLLFPGLPHKYGVLRGPGWSEVFLLFDSPMMDALLKAGTLNTLWAVHELRPVDYWKQRVLSFIEQAPPTHQPSGLREMGRLIAFLGEALDSARDRRARHDEHWLSAAQTHLERTADIPAVARALGLSYETFRKKFHRLAGLSPKQYRDRRVFDRACEMLRAEGPLVEEVAAQLGFCDAYHFSKQFKKKTGLTPSDFRVLYATGRA